MSLTDLPRAFSLYEKACDGGFAPACYSMGYMAETGQGVGVDFARAALVYERGCDGGDRKACSGLGFLHLSGKGVAQDDGRAVSLFKKACVENALPWCAHVLGFSDKYAVDRKAAEVEILKAYTVQCDGGLPVSCVEAGAMYAEGRGVEVSARTAGEFYRKACERGLVAGCEGVKGSGKSGAVGAK